jgi:BlaI family penicillinase repressor
MSPARRPRTLSALQIRVLRSLWERGQATVAEVHADLAKERRLAPTTVATVLTRLEAKGIVAHRAEGRQFVYRAVAAEGDVRRSMVADLADRLFEGDVAALVHHLLDARSVAPDDLQRIAEAIERKKREARRGR